MAALMFTVPEETARILTELDVPGTPEKHSPHVTVVYLGKDIPIERIGELLPVLYEVTSKTAPFTMSTDHITTFPAGDDGVPVIARVQSPELHAFRKALCASMDEAGIEYDRKFPTFKPHVTVAYAEDPDTEIKLELDPPVQWGGHELLLWGSNRGTGRLVVKFPLSLSMARLASIHDIEQMRDRIKTGREARDRGELIRTTPRELIDGIMYEVMSENSLQRATVQLAMWGKRDRFV